METRATVTLLLDRVATGDAPQEALFAIVYDDLRRLASARIRQERAGQTLCTTDLVHEAYLRLADAPRVTAQGRSYFFAAAGRAMRCVLVDAARRRGRARRGGGARALSLNDTGLMMPEPSDAGADAFAGHLLDLDDALARLGARHPRAVQVVECRYFAGLSVEETAEALGVSERTIKSDWALARARLYLDLGHDAPGHDAPGDAVPGGVASGGLEPRTSG